MKTRIAKLILFLLLPCAYLLPTPAGAQNGAQVSFERDIRPLLMARCLQCHSEKKQSGGLRLDAKAFALRGGQSGAAINPGKAVESLLYQRVTATNADERMPPVGERLTAAELALLKAWIDTGAVWDGETGGRGDRATGGLGDEWTERLKHWAWQPITKPAFPVTAKLHNPIDEFIAAKLAANGLAMSPEADRRTLIRRLSFDLLGLPPTPEQVTRFVNDSDPQAYEKLVDEMLQSPRYGERWARHWLDVVHYGDTHGYDKDKPRPNAWPYRDYVIRAFNEDKPYARFVEEQIAGDVLFPGTRDGIEALGFIAAGPWDFIGHAELPETKTDGKIARHLDRDDMVANTIGTFAGVTVHCAQCHNHKFDPITQEDYYSLQAVFAALDRADKKYFVGKPELTTRFAQLDGRQRDLAERKRVIERDAAKAAGETVAKLDTQIAEIAKQPERAKEVAELRARRAQLVDAAMKPETLAERNRIAAELAEVTKELAGFPKPEVVFAGTVHYGPAPFTGTGANGGKPRPIHVLARGQVTTPGREVAAGALSMLTFQPARFALSNNAPEGQRRAALAHWLTDANNPLTWRSIVNRVWQYHFGAGLVTTPNDFGRNGAKPSHPELLDWLAAEFRDTGGSLKKLHKLIVMSAAYRQASAGNAKAEQMDSGNALLWRQNRRKLEAEAVRDAVLAVTGKLDLTMGGAGWQDFVVEHPEHSPHYEYGLADPEDVRTWRRSIYRFIVRSQTQPWMTALDCADPSMRVDKRNESLSPLQALALLNNGFMISQARHFAERLQQERPDDLAAQIERAHWLAFGRAPSAAEGQKFLAFAKSHGLPNLCRVLLNLNEFSFAD
ncbi:MAG TPA: PSD1 and planctomycete cytochrome C domain-containing protein [Blastocatellia bacterium]|nr:PSD1 and planctomycete cytochrome C domain-containing protein [Blastocatellia bacterium]HMV85167.1 PSD1 and planctomycete cytochrome C domain-containing protein [Blastocatellia bacterium]HMY71485.1 PSD1 and planctomycete cytochrome C domain-containing protein [Blastocatellia bacterium]HMZ20270.1 PSD1 and planctomycete cytochrome C domain-containing protein [Blastocatellia bacterium]HNG28729.1 PSD1 and planctomycete cytochrome C domain-containing protein [Blastocatellia bacterium]